MARSAHVLRFYKPGSPFPGPVCFLRCDSSPAGIEKWQEREKLHLDDLGGQKLLGLLPT